LEDAPQRLQHALSVFDGNLTVKPISGTRLIQINYLNPDPKLAAAVVNELMQALADYNFQTRFNATNQASSWLTGQLVELRKQSEDLQSQVVNLERQSGVYSLGTVDATGQEQAYSGVLDQLQQDTAALSLAEQNTIMKGAVAHAAETGNAEMLSGLAGSPAASGGGSSSVSNSLGLIQALRQQQALQQAALQEAEAKYGPSYPKLAELRANLAADNRSIHDEVERVKNRAENDYEIAVQSEAKTRANYEKQKMLADQLNDKAVKYMIVRQEASESRNLYEDLLKRLKEAGVIEGLKSSNITVVDPGRVPASPKKPNVLRDMLAALLGGLFLGSLAGLVVDMLDNKLGSIQEAEELTGQTLLGATPFVDDMMRQGVAEGKTRLTTLNDPHSTFAEALRSIRTSILLTGGGSQCRVILITSSIPGEGNTVISSNLAVVLAQSNRKVLLVDIDMRRGALGQRLNLAPGAGLSELLAGQQQEPRLQSISGVPLLDILRSGTSPPNPADLLDSKFGRWLDVWREKYDFIVLDGPPLLPVTDAHIVHPMVDITLLVTRNRLTERSQLQRSYRLLADASKHFVGVILNGLRPQDENYYGYYGYRKYAYHYGEDNDAKS
jgi:capsular exopolysaccharide synthesis family protein